MNKLRILQLIDSLDGGGAERMAVNYANVLVGEIDFSAIVVSRKEGVLKHQIKKEVGYLYLDKKRIIDFNAILKLKRYVISNDISIIHAHSTSFFLAILLKFIHPKIKVIWHDHNGNRLKEKNDNMLIKWLSYFFWKIITVNSDLKSWTESNLHCKNVIFLPNFTLKSKENEVTFLSGIKEKRMVFIANLRDPKNHLFFLNCFYESELIANGWTLHLIGKDYYNDYSLSIKAFISENGIQESVIIYDNCQDVFHIMSQASVGVLASTHEGFPVTLIEYGLAKLLVLSTNVGYCSKLINDNKTGFLFSPKDKQALIEILNSLICDVNRFESVKSEYNKFVTDNFAQSVVISKYLKFISDAK